jgi:hypothetical protein
MKNKHEFNINIFIIAGLVVMSLITGIKYLTSTEFGIVGLLLTFIYGGLLGNLAISKHTSLMKNLVFFSFIFYVIWSFLNPITIAGDNIIINKIELWVVILIGIILLEREILNSIARILKKPQKLMPAFFGTLALFVLLSVSGVDKFINLLISDYWYIGAPLLAIWLLYLYFFIGKQFKSLTGKINKTLKMVGR